MNDEDEGALAEDARDWIPSTTVPLIPPPPMTNERLFVSSSTSMPTSPTSSTPRSSATSSSRRAGRLLASDVSLTDTQRDLILANLDQNESATLVSAGLGKQTWSRPLVINFLSKFKCYYPLRDDPNAPSLEKGWAYFEHFTLPRRYKAKIGGHHIRAAPGEGADEDTKLYSFFGTPMESLSDWGIGMVMYFASLRATFIIFVLAGALNVYNVIHYAGDEYDPGEKLTKFGLPDMLRYSAVCSDREWVVCAEPEGAEHTCKNNKDHLGFNFWENVFTKQYYGTAEDADGQQVTLINRTTCDMATFTGGMINYGTLMLLILCMMLYSWYLSKKEVRFDEDNTTPSDYSIVVHNPPPDAVDADEWRDFFSVFSDKSVTLVTVALNNQALVAKLVQRRKDIKRLKRRLLVGTQLDFEDFEVEQPVEIAVENARRYREGEEAQRNCLSKLLRCILAPLLWCLGKGTTETAIWDRIKATTKKIQELQKREYKAAAVYVTFETETGQRTALEALNASEMEIIMNKAVYLDSSALFRGRVLRVEEACEPNAVRWTDLDSINLFRYPRKLVILAITFGLVGLSGYILLYTRVRVNTILFSVILTALNSTIPIVLRLLVSYEKHYDEGSMQRSFYVNITLFRWVNTAVVTRYITPILVTIGKEKIDLINTINTLMLSEMFVAPLLRYLDFFTILDRHYFAPRAKTEEELFDCFGGGWYNLAERFTDFTKVLLLCTYYSAFYPLMYFLGAGILFFQYWMDKFLLLRSWQRAPYFGPETAQFSRMYFSSLALLLGAISTAYAYFKSPFTMLCSCADNDKECTLPDTLEFTNVKLTFNDDETIPSVLASTEGYYFCNQDINRFPPLSTDQGPDKWMTHEQETLSSLYGMTCFVLLIMYCVFMFGQRIVRAVVSFAKRVYKPTGKNQHKDFSSGIGTESFGYVPQLMEVPGFHFPLLICNIDDIDVDLIGWKDPNCSNEVDPYRNYDNQNLIFDIPHETLHRSRNKAADKSSKSRGEKGKGRPIFSVIKQYPPEWALPATENQLS